MRRKLAAVAIALLALAGCTQPADVASSNISTAADNFEIERRIVFYNGITDSYMLEIIGRCSLGNFDTARRLSITCKVGPDAFEKHFLGLSDNVTYFVEQTEAASVSEYRYRVVFRPSVVVPDAELDLGGDS